MGARGWLERVKVRAREMSLEVSALGAALRHPDTPWYAKALIAAVVAYALSPIDLIPDAIPLLGQLDDLLIVPVGVALAVRLVPREVLDQCRDDLREGPHRRGGGGLVAAGCIVALWLISLATAVAALALSLRR